MPSTQFLGGRSSLGAHWQSATRTVPGVLAKFQAPTTRHVDTAYVLACSLRRPSVCALTSSSCPTTSKNTRPYQIRCGWRHATLHSKECAVRTISGEACLAGAPLTAQQSFSCNRVLGVQTSFVWGRIAALCRFSPSEAQLHVNCS